ncbi:cytochrome c oxidase assembly factor CtaG [Abyssicoccus albus]|uniref:cytochrome c oxidase assembly factor CtaG n=1 Tax=Abyssicoccus albus TaxID=1817405 RepID=UPI00097E3786|nr:cytochrome c oxidase assembly factor CtaG [Abyssicoccus albus]AQL55962.1 cytochrome c oxidase assembly factor CtaG [Abyssicoccus albus]
MFSVSSLEIFGFFANWSPFFIVFILFTTVLYFLLTTVWRHDIEGNRPLKRSEAVWFILIMITLYIVKGSPIDLLSHILFSYHMLQMAVVYLLITPLLYFAIPEYWMKYVVNLPVIKPIVQVMTKPLIAIILFNGVFSIYHLPVVLDFLKQEATAHSVFNVLLFILALFMWYPVFNKHEEHQMFGLYKLLYIFVIGVLLTPACGLIIFSQSPMYNTYTDGSAWLKSMEVCVPTSILDSLSDSGMISGPEYFTNETPLHDQQTGGVVMKILQELFFGVMLFYVFYQWRVHERVNEQDVTENALRKHQEQQEYYNQFH